MADPVFGDEDGIPVELQDPRIKETDCQICHKKAAHHQFSAGGSALHAEEWERTAAAAQQTARSFRASEQYETEMAEIQIERAQTHDTDHHEAWLVDYRRLSQL